MPRAMGSERLPELARNFMRGPWNLHPKAPCSCMVYNSSRGVYHVGQGLHFGLVSVIDHVGK